MKHGHYLRRTLGAGSLLLALSLGILGSPAAYAQAKFVQTPYANPKVLVDVYLDHPAKMSAALYWLRSFITPQVVDKRLSIDDIR